MKILNLLPPAYQERRRREHFWLLLHGLSGLMLVAITMSAIILTLARVILVEQFAKIKKETSLVRVERLFLEGRVDALNKKIAQATAVQEDFSKWTTLLGTLVAALPPNVKLDYLAVNKAEGNLRLNGLAEKRTDLLAAQQGLENSLLFTNLESPLSNFLSKIKVDFRFLGKLKKF